MKHLIQNFNTGEIKTIKSPKNFCSSNSVLIKTSKTLISVGTEKMLVEFAKSNLLDKAKAQPDKVKQVLQKIQTDGLLTTIDAVRSKLTDPIPLGYSNVGIVTEVGQNIYSIKKGDRVVSNGPHAEAVNIKQNLICKIPDNVSDETAAFTIVSAIGLQGIRLLNPTLGERIVVIGLGLIGQLTVQILLANGCAVLGVDIDSNKVKLAESYGAKGYLLNPTASIEEAANAFTNSQGADGVIITASTKSNEPIESAAKICRKRGRIILVGVTNLNIPRHLFYDKELTFQVSCAYGPGRYDSNYEEKGMDYPIGFVRWTEQRNFESVLQLMSKGTLNVDQLITHRYPFEKVEEAYQTILNSNPLGVILEYNSAEDKKLTISLSENNINPEKKAVNIGFIGVGNFAKMVLLPALKVTDTYLHTIVSNSGLPAVISGKKFGFAQASSNYKEIISDKEINTLFISTRHNTHAQLVIAGLEANKHVFVEKPLGLTYEELKNIYIAHTNSSSQLMVGFNRRFSPFIQKLKKNILFRKQPLSINLMVNAGNIPLNHWVHDPEIGGGRIIGEGCHFIDLIRFIVGKPIESVHAISSNQEDNMIISLQFEDQSIGSVQYFANGNKLFPKERLEVFCEGKVHVIDNFKVYKVHGSKIRFSTWKQDKGHKEEVKQFIHSIKTGKSLIPINELLEVSIASIEAVNSAKNYETINIQQKIDALLKNATV